MNELAAAPHSNVTIVDEPRAWSGGWLVVGIAVACLPISAAVWFAAVFGGHDYWKQYLLAGLIWAVPLGGISLGRGTVGTASRCLAFALAALGVGFLLLGLPSFLQNPGWQF